MAMAEILIERVENPAGLSWLRMHAQNREGFALCSTAICPDVEGIEVGAGQITCPDCISVITCSKSIADSELAPEYDNQLFNRRHDKGSKS